MVTKLNAVTEHSLRFETLLAISRSLREQVDWEQVRSRTAGSPFARAFFVLLEGLGIIPGPGAPAVAAGPRGVAVRVVTGEPG